MTSSKTISVEPAKMTLADKTKIELNKAFRVNVIKENNHQSSVKDTIDIFFPIQKNGMVSVGKFYLPLKSLFSALLIISGISMLQMDSIHFYLTIGIIEIIMGSFLALGLCSRIIMALGSIFFASLGIISLRHGLTDINSFSLMFGSLIFFLTGSGKYSLDYIIRKKILKKLRENKLKRRNSEITYKTFSYVSKNI